MINIWISCHPTGQEGEILVDESKSGVLSNNGFGMFSGMDQDTYEKMERYFNNNNISMFSSRINVIFYLCIARYN